MSDHTDGRRVRKISRACDYCRAKKLRCSGTKPCALCERKRLACSYDALYLRGRPPTPLPSTPRHTRTAVQHGSSVEPTYGQLGPQKTQTFEPGSARLLPDLESSYMHGQYIDTPSGLAFLRRAQERFARQNQELSGIAGTSEDALLMTAGDKPLLGQGGDAQIPDPADAKDLLDLYFDVCVATYRILHRPTVDLWLASMHAGGQEVYGTYIDQAKQAILFGLFAIATFHRQKHRGAVDDQDALLQSDSFFREATRLTDAETGLPQLESVQARLIQVFYLLMTCRMNRAWYAFGNVLQLISALGFHRMDGYSSRSKGDYIQVQCCKRVFWTAYILDKYLGVVLGRPPHFHDEDLHLNFPDCVNDENMTTAGPTEDDGGDCHIDAFVFNARLARIVGRVSRKLYPLRPVSESERLSAVQAFNGEMDQWTKSLPPLFSTVRPSSLIRSFRRQATALKVASYHACMHINRPSLLRQPSATLNGTQAESISRCLSAASRLLRIVDDMSKDGPLFHAFWWTHYVAFCALSVIYVWEIQETRLPAGLEMNETGVEIAKLAERCHNHLAQATATNSPSRRYAIILDELRAQASKSKKRAERGDARPARQRPMLSVNELAQLPQHSDIDLGAVANDCQADLESTGGSDSWDWLNSWQPADWLDLDAFVSF